MGKEEEEQPGPSEATVTAQSVDEQDHEQAEGAAQAFPEQAAPDTIKKQHSSSPGSEGQISSASAANKSDRAASSKEPPRPGAASMPSRPSDAKAAAKAAPQQAARATDEETNKRQPLPLTAHAAAVISSQASDAKALRQSTGQNGTGVGTNKTLDATSNHSALSLPSAMQMLDNFMPQPLPSESTKPCQPQLPGAYSVNSVLRQELSPAPRQPSTNGDSRRNRNVAIDRDNSGLLTATEIHPDDEESLVQATEVLSSGLDPEKGRTRREWIRARGMVAILVISLVLIAVVVVCVKVATKGGDDPNEIETMVETAETVELAPSLIDQEERVLELLPAYTVAIIRDKNQEEDSDEEASQLQAYQWIIQDPLLADYTDHRILQRFVLATFFYSLGGNSSDGWYRDTNWLSYDHHECDWQTRLSAMYERNGLEDVPFGPCDGENGTAPFSALPHQKQPEGTFEHLWIENNYLHGTIPEELYLLSGLQTLILDKNLIHGTISSRIAQLQDLRVLYLDSNDLTGTIPTEIGLLSNNLSYLWVLGNSHLGGTIPSEIAQLWYLKELLIDSCNLTGTIPSTVGLMKKLEHFWAWSNPLTGTLPTELGLLDSMRELGLWNCALSGEIPSEVGRMSSMKELAFDTNYNISGSIPSEIGLLSKLITLHIGETSLSRAIPTEMGLLTNLGSLRLHSSQLSSSLPTEMGMLTKVFSVWLFNNSVTGSIPPELAGSWESLTWLDLSENQLTGSLPSEMMELTHLTHLQLDNNWLSGSLPSLRMENMTVLSLHSNSLTGEVPSELGLMTDLTVLSIHNTNLVGTIPMGLCDFSSWTEGIHVGCELVECSCEVCICDGSA